MLKDYRLAPLNGGKPARVVIFLHGLGDRGDGGLLTLGEAWAPAMPDCEFLCPDAVDPFDMAPPDFAGRQWFSLRNFTPQEMALGARTAAPALNEYIDHVLQTRNLTADKLALVGFSQGTIMALFVALRRPDPVACIVGYSGLLTEPELLSAEKKSSPPVILIHGSADEVIPHAAMAHAEAGLRAAFVPVTTLTCHGAPHTIDQRGMEAGFKFLRQHLKS